MRTLLTLLAAGGAAAGCADKGADSADTGPTEGALRALTYNVHGLPPELTGDDTAGRMAQIAPLLDGFDVVGLQEDFDDANHDTLAAGSHHATQVRFAEALEDRFYGPGLAVFADFAELDHRHEHYDACYGTIDGAGDCLASKGFQVVRLRLGGGLELDVYNTHLEAGGGGEDDAARAVHVDQLLAALSGWSDGRAVLFLGDTNLHEDDPDDAPLLERLLADGGLTDSCEAVGCDDPGRIDRLLFRSSDELSISATAWAVEPAFVDEAGVDLSDHEALSADFTWAAR